MSSPVTVSTTPEPHDTQWWIRTKTIIALRTSLGVSTDATAPKLGDTRRTQLDKIERLLSGNY